MSVLRMNLGADSYDIVIERGALKRAGELLNLDRKVLVLTDDGVPAEYAAAVAGQAKDGTVFTVLQGEDSKSLERFGEILSKMLSLGFTRKDAVVAVGGGVVGDLAGFAASAYMRGVDFYNIPTTVLSQVDSSIGGKTAVNLDGIKNIVGAFYQPKKVLVDLDLLATLPDRQISNGLAEAVKMSLTSDADLFELFEKGNIKENLDEIITRSLIIKKNVVEQDEKEQGLRKILNFGHTIGHGIESFEHLNGLYHGECVALGMIPMVGDEVRPRLLRVLERLNLPTSVSLDADEVYRAMTHDKKGEGDTVTITTVPAPGQFEMKKVQFEELIPMIEMVGKL
ncbi:3-dehydroquinate synthase [uncultured Ruminococcus sp.]|uniref:3-dehydroquinate synthase n=1 Tax=uncultured Ruminococcus sp. TaxID=165186 RepID=UPI00293046D2|nr:3-dehydroquinate synthase [uncultured Ruminococcus sp.]